MSLSMYQASVPVFLRAFANLSQVLQKAKAHAEAKKIDPIAFTQARLYPDMLPLVNQIRIASDVTKGGAARLAGVEVPKMEDNEVTFDDLLARIEKTVAFLKTLTPAQIDGSEARDITLPMRAGPVQFKGQDYLLGFVLPNLYFHCTTAYAILRHNGVEIGKMDFLGKLQ
jgi:hypothetical protein